jgi:hypothetical protein
MAKNEPFLTRRENPEQALSYYLGFFQIIPDSVARLLQAKREMRNVMPANDFGNLRTARDIPIFVPQNSQLHLNNLSKQCSGCAF